MKRIIYIICFASLFVLQGIYAQTTTDNNIKFEQFTKNKDNNQVRINLTANLNDLKLGTSDMITLTPILRSQDHRNELVGEPIVITGKQRSITLKRAMDFEGYTFDNPPQGIYRRYNRKYQNIPISINAAYQEWMDQSDLYLIEGLACCGLSTETIHEYKVISPVFEQKVVAPAEFRLSYITPPVEEVKQRSETYTAQLNFTVGKDKIERDLKNNAEILDEIDGIVKKIKENDNLSDIEFKIVGYASPEGDQLTNMQLAQDRSKAFAYYLTEKYEIPAASLKLDWMGDDWAGLSKAVTESEVEYKDEILKALETLDPVRRKARLRQIAGGKAYKMLVDDFYPSLRRNEYTISYVAKNFDMAEAKEQLKQNPQHLSLNEMFTVANSYPKTSAQFKEVFEIAARIYPDNKIAQLNAAAVDIENSDFDRAISRLEGMESAEACNNLGVAYAKKGDMEQALQYIEEAIALGSREAINNKRLLENQ